MNSPAPGPDLTTDVLIVGGGGAGLTASMLLAELGVDHLLVSSLPTTSDLPKAHVLNQRTMEILDDVGAAEAVERLGTPAENMAATAFYAGFAGEDPDAGRLVHKLECWGAGGADENWLAASSRRQCNLPQIRLEPVLKDRADELSPGRVRFNHELIDLHQDEHGVSALIRDKSAEREYRVRCRYLIGADGGRTVPGLVGIGYEGLGVLSETATLHVTADLSRWARDPDVLIRWIISPSLGAGAVLVPMGPNRWGPESEEWVIHIQYVVGDPRTQSDEQLEADARAALGLGDAPMEIHRITRWTLEAVMAERFREGRVFLAGDAGHRHPPTGGLGLTSGMQDVHNLTWKLAAVLRGDASEALLATYEPERRSSLERNAQRSLENAVNHFTSQAALGVSTEQSEAENWAAVKRLWSGRPEDAEVRAAALHAMRAQSMEFCELNVEYGYSYSSRAIVEDGTPPPDSVDHVRVYEPSTRPGAPLPHAWLDDPDGRRIASKDVVRPGRFVLIAGEEGQAWCEATREIATASGLPLDAVRIGHVDGDLFDPRCTWLRHRGIGPEGAILVRPDRFVAWRSIGAHSDPAAELARALGQVLAREIPVPTPA